MKQKAVGPMNVGALVLSLAHVYVFDLLACPEHTNSLHTSQGT